MSFPNEETFAELKAVAQTKHSREAANHPELNGTVPLDSAAHEAQLAVGQYAKALSNETLKDVPEVFSTVKVTRAEGRALASEIDEDELVKKIKDEAQNKLLSPEVSVHVRESANHLAASRVKDLEENDKQNACPNAQTLADLKAMAQTKQSRDTIRRGALGGHLAPGSAARFEESAVGHYASALATQTSQTEDKVLHSARVPNPGERADRVYEDALVDRVRNEAENTQPSTDVSCHMGKAADKVAKSRQQDVEAGKGNDPSGVPNGKTFAEIKAVSQAKQSRDSIPQYPGGSVRRDSSAHNAELAVGEYAKALASANFRTPAENLNAVHSQRAYASQIDEDSLVEKVRQEAKRASSRVADHLREAANKLARSREQDRTAQIAVA